MNVSWNRAICWHCKLDIALETLELWRTDLDLHHHLLGLGKRDHYDSLRHDGVPKASWKGLSQRPALSRPSPRMPPAQTGTNMFSDASPVRPELQLQYCTVLPMRAYGYLYLD